MNLGRNCYLEIFLNGAALCEWQLFMERYTVALSCRQKKIALPFNKIQAHSGVMLSESS